MSEAPRAPGAPRLRARAGAGRRTSSRATRRSTWVRTTAACWWRRPTPRGFRVVEAYSRIVRLGEGLSQTGSFPTRPWSARWRPEGLRREDPPPQGGAGEGRGHPGLPGRDQWSRLRAPRPRGNRPAAADHHARGRGPTVRRRLHEPVRSRADAALVVDVGGGSTELSWVDLKGGGLDSKPRQFATWKLPIKAWLSIPIGVVTLAERFPEGERVEEGWFRAMVDDGQGADRGLPARRADAADVR
jgi:exopolyphosphatase/guanosine-5'-triphosphate,3'-diphosphate pyrophosphatase